MPLTVTLDDKVDGMADDDSNETDAEQIGRLFWGVRRRGPVQWASICIVLVMVIALFWLAIHYSEPAGFGRSR
jgi:uncharacterized membrane protein YvbJ